MTPLKTLTLLLAAATLGACALALPRSTSSASLAGTTVTDGVTSRAYLHQNNLPSSGLALEGYCPVAYFAVGHPVIGDPEQSSTHDGVTYRFASADAKGLFDKEPDKYVPAYGGWCAFGMAVSDKFPVDPTAFKIVDGKLMLFLRNESVDALELWNKGNEDKLMGKAAAHWKKVQG